MMLNEQHFLSWPTFLINNPLPHHVRFSTKQLLASPSFHLDMFFHWMDDVTHIIASSRSASARSEAMSPKGLGGGIGSNTSSASQLGGVDPRPDSPDDDDLDMYNDRPATARTQNDFIVLPEVYHCNICRERRLTFDSSYLCVNRLSILIMCYQSVHMVHHHHIICG
jgi:hypothetical protein